MKNLFTRIIPCLVLSGVTQAKLLGDSGSFSDADWASLPGFPEFSFVRTVVADASGNVYIGGDFTSVGGVGAKAIAKWNGTEWSTLGSGVSGGAEPFGTQVFAIAVSGTDLYVAGSFNMAGGVAATNIAKWNGTSWSNLGSGLSKGGNYGTAVISMVVSGSDLYVGGRFTLAGGVAANNIAKWDGTTWSALGSGVNERVNSLAVMGSNVYVAGLFDLAGGKSIQSLACWNPATEWSAVGRGIPEGLVSKVSVSGTNLFVGGNFEKAGGIAASGVAKWDGKTWSALGQGIPVGFNHDRAEVWALAFSGNDVIAGGSFNSAGGSPASRIAKWDGTAWSSFGAGVAVRFPASSGQMMATTSRLPIKVGFKTVLTQAGPSQRVGKSQKPPKTKSRSSQSVKN